MKLRVRFFVCTLLITLSALVTGCEMDADENEDYYNFKVISAGGNFEGYYIINGTDEGTFSGSSMSGSTVYYSFQKNLSSPTSVLVSATALSTSASSIEIYIYQNSELVDSIQSSQSDSTVTVSAYISYTFSSSSSDSDSDD